jgi:hypothetical protein
VTNEPSNLNMCADEYTSLDHLQAGNGQGLRILHFGLANLSSPTHTFHLSSLLHVPQIKKKSSLRK